MKLLKLKIENYKLFDSLTVDFQDSGHIAVFIGKNGSGKSTLIECITLIFSTLMSARDFKALDKIEFSFKFSLTYLLKKEGIVESDIYGTTFSNYVGVEMSYDNLLKISLFEEKNKFDGTEEIQKFLRSKGEDLSYLLPNNFVVYYSGISNTLYDIYERFQRELILGTLTGEVRFDQPFYYFLPKNLPAILIGLLSYEYGDVPDMLASQFGITGFTTIKLTFKRPEWAKPRSRSDNYWGGLGELAQFMDVLKGASTSEFKSDSIIYTITRKTELGHIWGFYGTEKRLFEYLVSLQSDNFLDDIAIELVKDGRKTNFHNISEGEKQLLTITGIKELLAADNSLFLLDEPDTYLHPEWKREFVYKLFKEESDLFRNYSVLTTHSPNILSALKKGQLNVLVNENGKSRIKEIGFNPYGKPVDQLLTDFFDLESLRYIKVQDQLNEAWNFIRADDFQSKEFNELFDSLNRDLGRSDRALIDIRLEIAKRRALNEKN